MPAGARVLRDPGVVVWHDHRHRDGDSFVKRSEWYIELLRAALQRDPGDTRAMFYLARTFKDLGRWFEAIEAYERYLVAGGWRDERWQACYDMALCWRELGEWEQARARVSGRLAIDPRRVEMAGLIGRLHYEAREWREAVAYVAPGGRRCDSRGRDALPGPGRVSGDARGFVGAELASPGRARRGGHLG